jgi:hypothetical protein
MRKKPVAEKPERICGQAQTLSEFETTEDLSAYMVPSGTKQPASKFTVRGEHNVWHVYRNEERLEPPFRNEERAKIERIYHERSHAIRNERK